MDAATRAEFQGLLRILRDELEETLRTDDARLAAIRAARADTTDDDEHDPEGATLSAEWSRAEGQSAGVRQELAEVDRAEQKLTDGRYGLCEVCGQDIPLARLRIKPAARRCVNCAD